MLLHKRRREKLLRFCEQVDCDMAVQDLNTIAFPTLSEAQIAQLGRYAGDVGQFVHEFLKEV